MSVVRQVTIPLSYGMATKSLTHHERGFDHRRRLVIPLILSLSKGEFLQQLRLSKKPGFRLLLGKKELEDIISTGLRSVV